MNGFFVYGRAFLSAGQPEDDPELVVSSDPVYLPRDYIERGIADGTLKTGIFNNVKVQPSVEAWPPEWRFLKEQ